MWKIAFYRANFSWQSRTNERQPTANKKTQNTLLFVPLWMYAARDCLYLNDSGAMIAEPFTRVHCNIKFFAVPLQLARLAMSIFIFEFNSTEISCCDKFICLPISVSWTQKYRNNNTKTNNQKSYYFHLSLSPFKFCGYNCIDFYMFNDLSTKYTMALTLDTKIADNWTI